MANFEIAFEQTMKAEGGYVHDPDDPEGKPIKASRDPEIPNGRAGPILIFLKPNPISPNPLMMMPISRKK